MPLVVACTDDGIDDFSIPQALIENPPADAVPYTFTNELCTTIVSVFVTPNKCDYWGLDWTGKDVLRPGESFTVYVPEGRYAFMLKDATYLFYDFYQQKVKEDHGFLLSYIDGTRVEDCPASVTIVNQSDQVITGFYNDSSGGYNWLGQDTLQPGESIQILMVPAMIDVFVTVGEFERFYLEQDVIVDRHITIAVTGD
ncbi:MAG: hypothetical protein V2J07_02990 [Anaerolineae bacterium]|nr:hypothetical protein [Anaerolineae bacterium]